MATIFHVYVEGKLLITKANAAKAYSAAEMYMAQRKSVWVTSRLIPES